MSYEAMILESSSLNHKYCLESKLVTQVKPFKQLLFLEVLWYVCLNGRAGKNLFYAILSALLKKIEKYKVTVHNIYIDS